MRIMSWLSHDIIPVIANYFLCEGLGKERPAGSIGRI